MTENAERAWDGVRVGGSRAANELGTVSLSDYCAPEGDYSDVAEIYAAGQSFASSLASSVMGLSSGFSFDFVKFDIFRDFFQIIGLFFSGFRWPDVFIQSWGVLTSFVAFDLDISLNFSPLIYFWINIVIVYVFMGLQFIVSRGDPDRVRDGLEVRNFQDRSKRSLLLTRAVFTILATMYLPVTRNVIEVFLCDSKFYPTHIKQCYKGDHIGYLFLAVITLFLFCVYFPRTVFQKIERYKPKIRVYDAEGKLKDYTNEDYRKDLAKDVCPYKFLYDGYEREFATYKVRVMIFKSVLVFICVFLSVNVAFGTAFVDTLEMVRSILTLIVVFLFTSLAIKNAPFIKKEDDWIDRASRLATLLTMFIGVITAASAGARSSNATGGILVALHAISNLCLFFFTIKGSAVGKRMYKKLAKKLDFSVLERDGKNVRLIETHDLNLTRERKLRIWHPFWDSVFLGSDEYKPPQEQKFSFADNEKMPPYLLNFQGSVGERFIENKEIAADVGYEEYGRGLTWQSVPQNMQNKLFVEQYIEGIDAFFDRQGSDVSYTKFGKLYSVPFPFKPCIIYDDLENAPLFLDPATEIGLLCAQNNSPEVVRRKDLRLSLRALSGHEVYFWFEKDIQKQKTRKDRDNNVEIYHVTVHFTFQRGTFQVASRGKGEFSYGFDVSLHFGDGQGMDSEGKTWTNEHYTANPGELGINANFDMTPELQRLLLHQENAFVIARERPTVEQKIVEYRTKYMSEKRQKAFSMSYGFWWDVYNRDSMPRDHLLVYFQQREENPLLREFASKHAQGIDFLYSRLSYFDSHPSTGYWFTFWHDVWENNQDVAIVKTPKKEMEMGETEKLFNPKFPGAICYNPMKREDLVTLLRGKGLQNLIGKGWVPDTLLDVLYSNLDRFMANYIVSPPAAPAAVAQPVPPVVVVVRSSPPVVPHPIYAVQQPAVVQQDDVPRYAWNG